MVRQFHSFSKNFKDLVCLWLLMACAITAVAQTHCDSVLLSHDTTITVGNAVTLRAHNLFDYQWQPVSAFNNPSDSVQTVSTTSTVTYHVTGHYIGDNKVVNGDFENGNTGFSSNYTYSNSASAWGIIGETGTYTVNTSSANVHNSFGNIPCVDHTTGTGQCMFINGSETPNTEVWRQTITVLPNTDYIFITWVATLSSSPTSAGNALARLQFSINGVLIGNEFLSPTQTATWQRFYQVWNSGNSTTAVIRIVNQNTEGGGGNDFALDDISFSPLYPCDESVTVTVGVPLEAVDDHVEACRGTTLTLHPLVNDVIDNWCGTVQPEIVTPPAHATAQVGGTDILLTFDPVFTGVETMQYRICCQGRCDTAEITLTTHGSSSEFFETACDKYTWNSQTYTTSGPYVQRFTGKDGCDSVVTLYLTIEDCTLPVYLPTALSPGLADGRNDRLSLPELVKPQMLEFQIRIFDRWGNLVFYSEDKNFEWDGTRNGILFLNSVFVYELRYKTDLEAEFKVLKGTITVL